MKNKILNFITLTVIYCFAISAVPKMLTSLELNTQNTFSQEKNILSYSAKLYCPVSIGENIVENVDFFPVPDVKKTSSELWSIVKKAEILFLTKFSKNVIFSRNVLINRRKLDLIFPFQYFW
ncbi:hypothetical protein [Wenyingzhuangia fucanilytica]|nr:hypothetical protein [Wenyingzhuangia fucanilytica]